jgi:hypothetical protein
VGRTLSRKILQMGGKTARKILVLLGSNIGYENMPVGARLARKILQWKGE